MNGRLLRFLGVSLFLDEPFFFGNKARTTIISIYSCTAFDDDDDDDETTTTRKKKKLYSSITVSTANEFKFVIKTNFNKQRAQQYYCSSILFHSICLLLGIKSTLFRCSINIDYVIVIVLN
jgi:hypothetical protein